ncbi:Mov34-domain-containing protein [Linderina pennispora]|uniref:Mov34-domain-containing protein n=1 Tax=Linderina pennispora TaxID=61395 RepID=A0A1Y1W789_9FUNG|nr:Mov34-domain-containing protein [Linderina pennispora]ORX69188.1 Mov34-domain-containing protein [Linderina pennispora]
MTRRFDVLENCRATTPSSGATNTATTTAQQCYIHPVVLFSILDHFLRRNDNQERVIGTLLGVRSDDGRIVEIRSSFAVPHFETEDQVEVDMEHHRTMYTLHKKASAREQIVGWYATGSSLSKYAALIQDFYSREAAPFSAVHLVMDTDLVPAVGAAAHPENCVFLPLPYELQYPDAELSALQTAADSSELGVTGLVSDMEQLEKTIEELHAMLDRVTKYVTNVVDGKEKPNNIVGKSIDKQFAVLFQSHLQDILMVAYLTNLTRAQLNIADRLQRIL